MGPELSGPFNKCKCFMVCGAKCSMLHVMWSMAGVFMVPAPAFLLVLRVFTKAEN